MTATGTEARVCQDIAQRQAKGITKYGTTVEGNPLGLLAWYKHHYEEILDAAVYVKRIIEVMEGVRQPKYESRASHLPPATTQSTTLEDGSVLTASSGHPRAGDIGDGPHYLPREPLPDGWRERAAEQDAKNKAARQRMEAILKVVNP